jgi:hypothetical protein
MSELNASPQRIHEQFPSLVLKRPEKRADTDQRLLARVRENAGLDLVITVQEHSVVCDGLFDELLDQKQFGGVDDGVDTLPKRLHWRECLE